MVSLKVLLEKIDFSILKLLFQIYVILNFSLKVFFLELKDGNFFANLQTMLPTCFIVIKRQSCSPSVNNAKSMNTKVTSNVDDCFSNIHRLSLSFVVRHGL